MVVVYETLLQEPLPFNESTSLPPPSVGSTSTLPALNTSTSSGSSWGPRRDPLYVVIPVTALYGAIFVAGLLGNVSTCVVIARNRHLHTATNYYLFSLAVSDLLLLVAGLPPEMYYIWSKYPYVFGEAFCVLQGFAAETSANATVLTITAFTVERYVAICHPFQAHAMSRLSRAVRFVLAIWLLALGLAVPQASQFGVVQERLPDGRVLDADHAVCAVKRVLIPHAFEISTCVFFVAPMTLITVLYVLIGVKLRRSSLLARRDVGGSVRLKSPRHPDGRKNYARSAHSTASRHVVKMLVAVVVAFFICWAPFHAQRLLAVYASPSDAGRPSHVTVVVYHALTYVSGVLYYLSTTVNPVLYHIMSHKFREAFKETLARYFGRRRPQEGTWRCYSVLSRRSSRSTRSTSTSLRSRPLVVSFRRRGPAANLEPPAAASVALSPTGCRRRGSTEGGPGDPLFEPPPCDCLCAPADIEIFQEEQLRIQRRALMAPNSGQQQAEPLI